MPIPSPKERPDLYDDYDGLPEGQVSAVTVPPELQKELDALKAGKQQGEPKPDEEKDAPAQA